jgi:hypothetical protein
VDRRSQLLISIGACLCTVVVAVLGCSKGPPVGIVRGTVTLDGQPLKEGAITFTPLDGQSSTAGARIADGKFETRASITKHRISITSVVVTIPGGKKIDKFSDRNQFVETVLVPEKYNTKSTLEWDVKSGLNEPHFDLKSK